MASNNPMTLDDIQREAHALYSNGIDVPAPTDEEDYPLRTTFINHYIREWEQFDGVKWRELYDYQSGAVFDANISAYECQQSFRRLAGKVKLVKSDGTKLVVPVYSIERLDDDDLPETYCWVSGRPGAYNLNFFGVPAEWVGAEIQHRFRRWATKLANPDDVPDMSNPNYLVKMLAARLFLLSRNTTQYKVNNDDAQDDLSAMITFNTEGEDYEETPNMGSRIHGATMGS